MSRTGMPVARSLHSNSSQSRSASLKRLRPSAVRSMRPSRPIRSYQRSVCCVSPHFSAASLVVQPVTTSSRVDVRAHSNANRRTSPGSGHGGGDCNFNGVTPEMEETPVTDVTTDNDQAPVELSAGDEQVLRELTERARTGGLRLTGEGGLLGKLTKMVVEGALEGELDDHLGYGRHDPAGRNGSNSRNGHRAKTVITDTGPVDITVPRD